MSELTIQDVDKNDALMSRGMAILSMLILHLFCRTGSDVYGTPLLWLDSETPFVYWFGFFAEVCVTLYSLQGGYGVCIAGQANKLDFRSRAKRCLKLMETYWIVDILFCGLGLIFDKTGQIPGSIIDFLKSLVLLHSYNGAWWYLATYIIITLLFAPMLYRLSSKTNFWAGMGICGILQIVIYFVGRFNLIPESIQMTNFLLNWLYTQLINLLGPLVSFFAGCLMCKHRIVAKIRVFVQKYIPTKYHKVVLLIFFILDFIAINLIHKAVFTFFNALLVFVIFHLWEKGKFAKSIFEFLGKHSTVIWLTHMFFYLCLFAGLVQKTKYPMFMLLFMLVLTVTSSYAVDGIKVVIGRIEKMWNQGK